MSRRVLTNLLLRVCVLFFSTFSPYQQPRSLSLSPRRPLADHEGASISRDLECFDFTIRPERLCFRELDACLIGRTGRRALVYEARLDSAGPVVDILRVSAPIRRRFEGRLPQKMRGAGKEN